MEKRQQLINDNMSLVYAVVHKYFPTFSKDEDIVQCGILGLCRAANTWIEDKGAFSTYAWRCIRNEISAEFRNRCKYSETLSLDYQVTGEDGSLTTLGDIIVGESDVNYLDIDDIYARLDQREINIFELKQNGLSTQEIADVTGYGLGVVRKCLRKVKNLLKEC